MQNMQNDKLLHDHLQESARESAAAREQFVAEYRQQLVDSAKTIGECIRQGGKILICGNGGSAADSQHFAAELVGRFLMERRALPAISLTTDTSNLTAIGNDYGYDQVFVRQVEALAKSGDVFFGISTSGNSKNVLLAAEQAKKSGCKVITLTGGEGGKLKGMADLNLNVARGRNSARIQESHIFAIHVICDLVERYCL